MVWEQLSIEYQFIEFVIIESPIAGLVQSPLIFHNGLYHFLLVRREFFPADIGPIINRRFWSAKLSFTLRFCGNQEQLRSLMVRIAFLFTHFTSATWLEWLPLHAAESLAHGLGALLTRTILVDSQSRRLILWRHQNLDLNSLAFWHVKLLISPNLITLWTILLHWLIEKCLRVFGIIVQNDWNILLLSSLRLRIEIEKEFRLLNGLEIRHKVLQTSCLLVRSGSFLRWWPVWLHSGEFASTCSTFLAVRFGKISYLKRLNVSIGGSDLNFLLNLWSHPGCWRHHTFIRNSRKLILDWLHVLNDIFVKIILIFWKIHELFNWIWIDRQRYWLANIQI